jgi:hypothetical protein
MQKYEQEFGSTKQVKYRRVVELELYGQLWNF